MFNKENQRIRDIEDAIRYVDRAGREYSNIIRELKNLDGSLQNCIKLGNGNKSASQISGKVSSLNGDKSAIEQVETSLRNDLTYFKKDLKDLQAREAEAVANAGGGSSGGGAGSW